LNSAVLSILLVPHFGDESVAQQQRDSATNSEAAIDETPAEWDTAYRSSDESERDNASASDQAEGDDPFITDRIEVGSDKRNSDH
jgi:hypothetical protein